MDTFFRRLAKRRLKLRLIGLGVVALLAGIAGWWVHADSASGRSAAAGDTTAPAITTLLEGVGMAEPAQEPAPNPAEPLSLSAAPERAELCGFGWVEAKADGSIDEAALERLPALLTPARERLVDAVRNTDEWGRAVAVWFGAIEQQRKGLAAASSACRDAACAAAALHDAQENNLSLQELAGLAATTTDPRIYALAFKSCGMGSPGASCALLSAAQWARLDSENAEPWLFVLDEAARRRDRSLVDEALHRIGTAARFEARPVVVAGLIAERAGADDIDKLAAHALGVEALGAVALALSPLHSLTNACSATLIKDANRRQECDAAAGTLAEKSDSMLIVTVGAAIGRRLEWPADRLTAIAALKEADTESMPFGPFVGNEYSCDNVNLLGQRFMRQAQVGEVQFARDWIASKGIAFDVYARQQEARRAEFSAQRVADASSAPASAVADANAGPGGPR